jgi:hypothetical protein
LPSFASPRRPANAVAALITSDGQSASRITSASARGFKGVRRSTPLLKTTRPCGRRRPLRAPRAPRRPANAVAALITSDGQSASRITSASARGFKGVRAAPPCSETTRPCGRRRRPLPSSASPRRPASAVAALITSDGQSASRITSASARGFQGGARSTPLLKDDETVRVAAAAFAELREPRRPANAVAALITSDGQSASRITSDASAGGSRGCGAAPPCSRRRGPCGRRRPLPSSASPRRPANAVAALITTDGQSASRITSASARGFKGGAAQHPLAQDDETVRRRRRPLPKCANPPSAS